MVASNRMNITCATIPRVIDGVVNGSFQMQTTPVTMAQWGHFLRSAAGQRWGRLVLDRHGLVRRAIFGESADALKNVERQTGDAMIGPPRLLVPTLEECAQRFGCVKSAEIFLDPQCPVVAVSWFEAAAFAAALGDGWRLPTEREWEFAARGGREGAHVYGTASGTRGRLGQEAHWPGNPETKAYGTIPVAQFAPNPYGLFDTAGNVWEYCVNPNGTAGGRPRAVRGGAWTVEDPRALLVTASEGFDLDPEKWNLPASVVGDRILPNLHCGFRCVGPAA